MQEPVQETLRMQGLCVRADSSLTMTGYEGPREHVPYLTFQTADSFRYLQMQSNDLTSSEAFVQRPTTAPVKFQGDF